jgi:hypothetical protein
MKPEDFTTEDTEKRSFEFLQGSVNTVVISRNLYIFKSFLSALSG